MLKKVVLPAPFGPIRLTMLPCGMTKSTSLTARRPPNSLRTPLAVSSSLMRGSVDGLVVDALLELAFVPPLGDQARRAEQHHQHDDQAVDAELVLRHLDRQPGLVDLRADRGQSLDVEPAEHHPAQDGAPDAAHPAEDDH